MMLRTILTYVKNIYYLSMIYSSYVVHCSHHDTSIYPFIIVCALTC